MTSVFLGWASSVVDHVHAAKVSGPDDAGEGEHKIMLQLVMRLEAAER